MPKLPIVFDSLLPSTCHPLSLHALYLIVIYHLIFGLQVQVFPKCFSINISYAFFSQSQANTHCNSKRPWLRCPTYWPVGWPVEIKKFSLVYYSIQLTASLLGPNIFLVAMFSNICNLNSSFIEVLVSRWLEDSMADVTRGKTINVITYTGHLISLGWDLLHYDGTGM